MKGLKNTNQTYFYLIIAIIGVMILNAFFFPLFEEPKITPVDYGTFLTQIENGKVKQVQIQDTEISYVAISEQGYESTYVTGRMDDPELVNRLHNAKVEFTRIIPKENSSFFNFILTWLFPLLVMFWLFQLFSQRMINKPGGMGNGPSYGKSNAKIYMKTDTGKSFADVAGQDEAKEALLEIVDFLHHPEKYQEVGAKVPKGVLLVGPPGTGKTLIAKAVAGESKVPFFSITGSEFVEMFVGMGAARVRDLFKQAQENAPCIVFIDEFDAIGKSRNASSLNGNDEREQTLNQLLAEMDGFDADKGIVILAATNRPEILDKALLRPGRFDRRIPIELPDLQGRGAILKVHGNKVKLALDVDLHAIAKATPGASGADLANIINEGALRAVRFGRKQVLQSDLEEAVELVIAGYQRKNAVIPMKDKLKIAYHEIGHALVAARQSETALVHKITIVPRTSGSLGYTMQVEQEEHVLMTKEQALEKITTLMGGRAAEELVFHSITSGASNDIEQATRIARAMVTRFGMSETFGMMALEAVNNPYLGEHSTLLVSAETASKIDEEVLQIIKSSYQKATQILQENMDILHQLANSLLEKETMTGEEFMTCLTEEKVTA
ncbi:ATP-dependent zinc metalloprotease FtsH [Ammoniphilus resinae]|uniref:ATP-dependent zinc metalloprotease FtsH n=1 Tax=Ammoniphilus resinae TaxID=861532 RepID=A0ABS4GIT6_9BACL|nr:ATP-dependent zinc metalloprotease FtsH [Ammoniphilus resinae]MBP1930139.1 cell division protease FtsH [Ammoniphilus resinae]